MSPNMERDYIICQCGSVTWKWYEDGEGPVLVCTNCGREEYI